MGRQVNLKVSAIALLSLPCSYVSSVMDDARVKEDRRAKRTSLIASDFILYLSRKVLKHCRRDLHERSASRARVESYQFAGPRIFYDNDALPRVAGEGAL